MRLFASKARDAAPDDDEPVRSRDRPLEVPLQDAGGFGLGFGLKPEGVGGPHATEVWTWGGSDGTNFWVDPKSGVFTVFMIQNAAEGPRLQARFNAAVFESLER